MKFSKDPKVTNNFVFAGRRGWPAMVKNLLLFQCCWIFRFGYFPYEGLQRCTVLSWYQFSLIL